MGHAGAAGASLLLALALAAAPGPLVLKDPPCGLPAFAAADCLEVRAERGTGGVAFAVTLGAPLAKGMFTCVHVWIDGDDDPGTGIGGSELWFRAAVGSRFRPSDRAPPAGVPAPLSLDRLSWSSVMTQETLSEKGTSRVWLNHSLPSDPVVEGATLRFTIPSAVLAEASPYASPWSFWVDVETTCGEQPLFLEDRGADEGLPIRVDGEDRDWSGGPSTTDGGGELFAPLGCLDLLRLRVDHEARRLFVCLDTEEGGFAEKPPSSPDLSITQSVTVLAEPVDSAYESPRRVRVFRGTPRGTSTDCEFAVKDRTVEMALPRTGLDGRVRVLAWSESVHHDRVPDRGSARLDGKGK